MASGISHNADFHAMLPEPLLEGLAKTAWNWSTARAQPSAAESRSRAKTLGRVISELREAQKELVVLRQALDDLPALVAENARLNRINTTAA